MGVRSIFSIEEISAGHNLPAGPSLLARAHLKQAGLGAAIGAVLVMAGGAALNGVAGLLACAIVGAMVGAVAAKTFAMYADDARQDAYWRERPYTDTASGLSDRDRAMSDRPATAHRAARRGLGDVAANPMRVSARLRVSVGNAGPRVAPGAR